MKKELADMIEKRRSIYDLGAKEVLSEQQISDIVKEAVKYCPTAFNSQSARVVVLFGESHHKLWDIVLQELKKVAPADGFAKTELKIASFAAGYATILFFEDMETVEALQKKYAGTLIGDYITFFLEKNRNTVEEKALFYGLQALLETQVRGN